MAGHITHKHAYKLKLGVINVGFVLEHCVRRELQSREVQAIVDSIVQGLEPLASRVFTYADLRPRGQRSDSSTTGSKRVEFSRTNIVDHPGDETLDPISILPKNNRNQLQHSDSLGIKQFTSSVPPFSQCMFGDC
jgi:hypothetical protein